VTVHLCGQILIVSRPLRLKRFYDLAIRVSILPLRGQYDAFLIRILAAIH